MNQLFDSCKWLGYEFTDTRGSFPTPKLSLRRTAADVSGKAKEKKNREQPGRDIRSEHQTKMLRWYNENVKTSLRTHPTYQANVSTCFQMWPYDLLLLHLQSNSNYSRTWNLTSLAMSWHGATLFNDFDQNGCRVPRTLSVPPLHSFSAHLTRHQFAVSA